MKRTQTTTTKEYDKEGNLVSAVTETVEEEDEGYIYPQYILEQPRYPVWGLENDPLIRKSDITCETK